jgi:hypothetical protein
MTDVEISPAEAYDLQSRAMATIKAYLARDQEGAEAVVGDDALPVLSCAFGLLCSWLELEVGQEEIRQRIDDWFRARLAG